ncbi:SRPBCC family protein [Gordonia aurantiaca]|uniref:SRPBCC family protein n=1 Tax=Gordonia sp. B21 TaxID=3151852 RepID=UPI0032641378
MTKRYRFTHSGFTTAAVEVVAEVVADADGWKRWARPMVLQTELESWGADSAHGAGAIRRVGAPPVWIREMILDWDPAVGQVYTVLSPALFSHYRGEIAFEPTEFGGTHIRWTVEFVPRSRWLGNVLRAGFSAVIAQFIARIVAHCDRLAVGAVAR